MNMLERDDYLMRFFSECGDILKKKGADYNPEGVPFSEIKATAAKLGIKPEQVLTVYMDKHWNAIVSHAKRGQLESEPIRERLKDLANYCALYAVMIGDGTNIMEVS